MTEIENERRPGGITALAILNIIFALIGLLGGLAMNAIKDDHSMAYEADRMEATASEMRRTNGQLGEDIAHGMAAQMRSSSPESFRLMFAFGVTGGILLFASGFGLLAQRRLVGRHVATGAAIALVACAVVSVMRLGVLFWGFPMLGAGYAVVLGLLVNTAYKPKLIR